MDTKVKELLERADWEHIIPALIFFAKYWLCKIDFENDSLLGGLPIQDIAEDIVNEVIRKILDGTRAWDPNKMDNLFIHLKNNIRSEISHLYDDMEYKTTKRFPIDTESEEGRPVEELLKRAHPLEEHSVYAVTEQPLDPEQSLEEKERINSNKLMERQILEKVKDNPELKDSVSVIMMGITKPQEIAEELGVSVTEIYNRSKRLRRIFKDYVRPGGKR